MAYKLGVLIVHGMGSQKRGFSDELVAELESRIGNSSEICWQEVYWADVLNYREEKLCADMKVDTKLDYSRIRRFVITAFGDALAYQRVPGPDEDVYSQIHGIIRDNLSKLRSSLRQDLPASAPDCPIVVIAHSLGCHIISNYIWDHQQSEKLRANGKRRKRNKSFGKNDLERMNTLAGIITFGCNIPLFSLAYKEALAIDFPPPNLQKHFPKTDQKTLQKTVKLLNFHDIDDVLGYPLKPLSPSFNQAVSEDIAIDAGFPLLSNTPLSHSMYWTDDNFTKPVAKQLNDLLNLI